MRALTLNLGKERNMFSLSLRLPELGFGITRDTWGFYIDCFHWSVGCSDTGEIVNYACGPVNVCFFREPEPEPAEIDLCDIIGDW